MPRAPVLDANDERALAVLDEHAQWPWIERVAVLDRVVAGLAHGKDGVVALVVPKTPQLEPSAQAPADRDHAGGIARHLDVHALRYLEQPDDQQRDVVVRTDVRSDLLENAVGQRLRAYRRGGADHRGQQIDAGVDAPAAALDEPVGVGDERRTGRELDRRLADGRGLDVAERRRQRLP